VDVVTVREGDRVNAGDVIARLSAAALLTELRTTEAEIAETNAGLDKLRAGPTAAEIALGRAAVARAEDRVGFARTRLARFTQLYEQSAATRPELEDAHEVATAAGNDLVEAQRRLEVLLASVRPEEIEAMRARLTRLEGRRRFLEDQVAQLAVVSPVSGVVATPERQLRVLPRQLVTKGALIANVYDFSTVAAQIALPEKEMADVRVGQSVQLRARAYPNVTFHGTVTAIATAAQGAPAGDQPAGPATATGTTFIVTARIRNDSLLLRPGMTGQAKVFAGERRIVDVLARRMARTLRVEVWSWW
jgi:multidrug resistance efflux pump